jgi:hypothetical protein
LKLPESPRARLGLLAAILVSVVLVAALVTVVRGGGSNAKPEPDQADRAALPVAPFSRDAYAGLGAWVDVYDYVPGYQQGGVAPTITPADLDTMASLGVRTLFLQAARHDDRLDGVVSPELLVPFLREAHRRGMRVVGWYYPTFADVGVDLARLLQIADFDVEGQRFDGLAVDIEDNQVVKDPVQRSANLVELSRRLHDALPKGAAVGATVMPAVQTEVINPQYWPGFPWAQLRPYYDVWLPMAYWSVRDSSSPYHSGYTYVVESVRRMRALVGDPNLVVHPVGGIADAVSEADARDFLRALTDTDAIGGSLYDYRTTNGGVWGILRGIDGALAAPPAPTTTQPDPTTTQPG